MKEQRSGWDNEKRRRKLAEQARREDTARRAQGNAEPAEHLAAYAALGEPPTDDPTQALIYAQNCMLVALREIVSDPVIDAEKRWKLISELGGKVGMTHAKALMQSKLDKVTKRLAAKKDVTGGPKSLVGIHKPTTARGGGVGRVTEPTDRPLLDSPASEDDGDTPVGGGSLG